MHLLHVQVNDEASSPLIDLEYHVGDPPPYAILSHRWGAPSDEVTYQDFTNNREVVKKKKGYSKIEHSCLQAVEYGLTYVWIDTCCIDKSSSAELSEAINSMYAWYRNAQICFAYLEDVPTHENPHSLDSAFRKSAWFTRGWTLQELIAPPEVIFMSGDWHSRPLGNRSAMAELIEAISKVPKTILTDPTQLESASIAQKMSWASARQTTRLEDEAYSLMGLFEVHIPVIYGEGRRAFLRLQEEIMHQSADQTIFAWESDDDQGECFGMLATSPRNFSRSASYESMNFSEFTSRFYPQLLATASAVTIQPTYSMTNFGLQIQLPVGSMSKAFHDYRFAILACTHGPKQDLTLIFLRQRTDRPAPHYYRTTFNKSSLGHRPKTFDMALTSIQACDLWIAGPDSPAKPLIQSMPSNENLYDGVQIRGFRVYGAAYYQSLGENKITHSFEGLNIIDYIIRQGEHLLTCVDIDTNLLNSSRPARWCAIGLQNSRPWLQYFQWSFSKKPQLMQQMHNHFDVINCNGFWHDASRRDVEFIEAFPDKIVFTETRFPGAPGDKLFVKLSKRRGIDTDGKSLLHISINSSV